MHIIILFSILLKFVLYNDVFSQTVHPCLCRRSSFITTTTLHPCNGLFSRTVWVSRHQKGRTILYFNEVRDDGWQWHKLDHMIIICTSLQTENHASTSPLCFTGQMPFLPPNQQRQCTRYLSMLNIL